MHIIRMMKRLASVLTGSALTGSGVATAIVGATVDASSGSVGLLTTAGAADALKIEDVIPNFSENRAVRFPAALADDATVTASACEGTLNSAPRVPTRRCRSGVLGSSRERAGSVASTTCTKGVLALFSAS